MNNKGVGLFEILLIIILVIVVISIMKSTTVKATDGETWINPQYVTYCEEIGVKYHISPEFLVAVIESESSGQKDARNGSCCGLMQVNHIYHEKRMRALGYSNIWDPYTNILVGADLLAELFEKYEDPALVLALYNGQSNAVANYEAGQISPYAKKIMDRARELERIHEK